MKLKRPPSDMNMSIGSAGSGSGTNSPIAPRTTATTASCSGSEKKHYEGDDKTNTRLQLVAWRRISRSTTELCGGMTLKSSRSDRFRSSLLDAPREAVGGDDGKEEDTCPCTLSSNSMFNKSPPSNSRHNDKANDNDDDDEEEYNVIVCAHPMLSKQDFIKAKARIWCNTFQRLPFYHRFVCFLHLCQISLTTQDKIRSKAAIES
jgi:hypothetical protein